MKKTKFLKLGLPAVIFIAAVVISGCKSPTGESLLTDQELAEIAKERKLFEIAFDSRGGNWDGSSEVKVIEQKPDAFFKVPEAPVRQDHVFLGWSTTLVPDIAYIASTPAYFQVTDDLQFKVNFGERTVVLKPGENTEWDSQKVLYAVWKYITPGSFLVIFKKSEGGEIVASVGVKENETIAAVDIPASVVRKHYTRNGSDWFYADGGGVFDISLPVLKNHEVYAKWTGNTYYAEFVPNEQTATLRASWNGSGYSKVAVVYPATLSSAQIPDNTKITFKYHTLEGWYADAAGIGAELTTSTAIVPDEDSSNIKKFYAQWDKIPVASGGTVTYVSTGAGDTDFDEVHTFSSSEKLEWNATPNVTARILVIGGGGAGGGGNGSVTRRGGGGGAGRFIEASNVTLDQLSYDVTVGAGGAAGAYNNGAESGKDSVFGALYTAKGGGAGSTHAAVLAKDGGSGGGGTNYSNANSTKFGAADPADCVNETDFRSLGNAGGALTQSLSYSAAGGGGAGAAGANIAYTNAGSAGGVGASSDISGAEAWYSGGGSAGGVNCVGGRGGGGNGAGSSNTNGGAGVDGTGGGGAGGIGSGAGGKGGDGVVIVRFAWQPN